MPGGSFFSRLLPGSMIARVYALYSATLLLILALGLGFFYRYQFSKELDDRYQSAVILIEVATQVVTESAVIGDFDTIKRTLDKSLPNSQFASAAFIDLSGAVVRSENAGQSPGWAPAWLVAQVAEVLPEVNRSLVVGGVDYGVLRMRFAVDAIAADLWRLFAGALLLAIAGGVAGLLVIWFPLKRWLGTLNRVDEFKRSATAGSDKAALGDIIDSVPLEFRHLFEQLAETSENLAQELAVREKAAASLRRLLATMLPTEVDALAGEIGDLGAVTQVISELVVERESSRVALDNQKFALDQHAIVSIADHTGHILYANDRFCENSGYSREELLGQTHALLNSGVHSRDFYRELWETILAGRVWQGEICNRARDGRLIWYSTSIVPLAAPGSAPEQFIGISTDITQRKEAEAEALAARAAAEQASQAKSLFLANMSHEIRTPMNGILGMTELALATDLNGEQRDYLSMVKTSADSLLGIINDILDFSKIEAGKMSIENTAFPLHRTVEETLRTLGLRAAEKQLPMHSEIAREVPAEVIGDPGRLRQVLLNLVGNAIKFTREGEIRVGVDVAEVRAEGCLLHFYVRDTGIGIPADKQQQVFEAFAQEDATTTRKYGGTGLGLSISSRLVELMGGRMWLESEAGRGSTFHFTIAYGVGTAVDRESQGEPVAPSPAEPMSAARILVVEDNLVNQKLATALLQRRGYQVEVANNGEEALVAVAQNEYAAVLMDMQMPVMDGLEATRRLRAREIAGELPRLPIIAMTANAMQSDREICLQSGMDDYLSKPINSKMLFATLQRWIDGRDPDTADSGEIDGPRSTD